jgi:hypothetical protein
MSRLRRRVITLAVAVIVAASAFLAAPTTPVHATDDILVLVGYSGGPFYEKRLFTGAELEAMSSGPYEYATIASAYYLRHAIGYGVPITNFISAAGIDSTNLWRIGWGSRDDYRPSTDGYGYAAWSWDSLTSPRYYYSALWLRYYRLDSKLDQSGIPSDYLGEVQASAQLVPTILGTRTSLRTGWSYNENFSPQYNEDEWNNMPPWDTDSIRLMFGQKAILDLNADMFIREVEVAYCIFGGKPEITFDEVEVEAEVGTEVTLKPTLHADDPVIVQNGLKDMIWETSNPDVATVTKNPDGSVTIKITGNGRASVGATFGTSQFGQFVGTGGFSVKGGTGEGPGGPADWPESGPGTGTEKDGTGMGAGEGEYVFSPGGDVYDADTESGIAGALGGGGEEGELAAWELKLEALEELEDQQVPKQMALFDTNPAWMYFAAVGGFLCLGGLRKIGSYELARDHYLLRKSRQQKDPAQPG